MDILLLLNLSVLFPLICRVGLTMMAILILIVVIVIRCEARIAIQGEDVTLNCSPNVSNDFSSVANLLEVDCRTNYIYWSKVYNDDPRSTLSSCLSLEPAAVTSGRITVNMTQTAYILRIQNVQMKDSAKYICHTYREGQSGGSEKDVVDLQVIRPPDCNFRPRNTLQIGDDITLTCRLQTNRNIKWLAPNGKVLSSRRVTAQQQSLVATVTLNEADNFENFTCLVKSNRGAYRPNCSVTPLKQIVVRITPEVSHVREGESVVFNCKAKLSPRKPHRYIYTWMVNSAIESHGINLLSYTIANVRLADNGTKVICRASINGIEDESYEAIVYVHTTDRLSTRSLNNADTVEFGVTSKIVLSTVGYSDEAVGYETHNPGHGETNSVSFIAGGVAAIVFLFVIVIVLVVILMKKKTRKNTTQRTEDTEVAAAGTPSAETTAQVADTDNPSREEDNTVIYALPLQKGGGNMKVRTLGVSINTPSSSTAVTSATTSRLETTGSSLSLNDNTESVHDNEVLYALPSQKGGGNIKVRTLINTSSKKSSSFFEGRSNTANEADMPQDSISNVSDVRAATATDEEILYALPSQKGGGYVKARTLDGASKKLSSSAAGRFSTVDDPSKTKPIISKISSIQTIDTTDSDEVVYALPSQKGGGSIKVRTLDGSSKKYPRSSTTRSHQADGNISTRATFPDSCGVQSALPSSTTKDDEDVYALPSQKGGGHIKVRTLDASYRT